MSIFDVPLSEIRAPDSETAIRPPARPGSGTGRTTTTPAIEAELLASMFGSVAGSASED